MTPPILGIFASAVTGGVSTTSFESIATVSVGSGGSSTVEFTSIPSTYTHLQLRYMARNSSANYFVRIGFNNNTTATDYAYHILNGTGSSITTGYENNYSYAPRVYSGSPTQVFGVGVVDILDYANTNKNKTFRGLGGFDANGSGELDFISGLWMKTNAITSIQISAYAGSYQQYSHFALYGCKSA